MTSPATKRSQSPPNAVSNGNSNSNGNGPNGGPPVRARPPPRSNFDLEPNPFEHSFSSTSAVSHSETSKHDHNSEHTHTRTGSGSKQHSMTNVANPNGNPSEKDDNDDSKPMLPPLAAIESPAGHGFGPWALGSSLRSGPLSPAMLAGPTTQQTPSLGLGAFDSSFVRTGLTPDVSRTGLTPLIGGPGGFPPPSPNTAALFALVNGTSASAPLGSNVAITPGTLNAITGALNHSLNAINQPTSMTLEQPQAMVDHHQQQNNGAYPNSDAFSSHDSANHAISNAASALYLLSQQQIQRHQNQAQQNALAQGQGQVNPSAVSGPPQQALPESPTTTGPTRRTTKRKTMEAPAPVPRGKKARSSSSANGGGGVSTRGSNKRKSKMDEDMMMDEDDFDDDEDDDDMYMDGVMGPPSIGNTGRAASSSGGRSKKPETEEEKRRNFLERNRQAALKCRQRKKAWLTALQAKVEFLTSENERLSNALVTSREEVSRLSQAVVAQGGAPSALLNMDPNSNPNGPNPNGSTILNSVNTGVGEGTASPVDHVRRNSGSSTATNGPTIQSSQPLHVNVPQNMSSGLNHGMQHHGHSHSLGHNGVGNVGGMGHNRSHSHGHGHNGVPAQNGVTVGGRGYGY